MTKSQMVAKLKKFDEKLTSLWEEVEQLQEEAEEARDGIEPYEGKMDLTDAQQERQDWFDGIAYALSNLVEAIEDYEGEVELDD